jgi:hypothetical protein
MMAQKNPPSAPSNDVTLIDPETGRLSDSGMNFIQEIWRQVVAGFVNVPCTITQSSVNVLQLNPRMHKEGANTYGTGMTFSGKMAASTTGAVTARVGSLDYLKVYKNNGLTQAGLGDLAINGVYLFLCDMTLDGGVGGLVVK